MCSRTRTRPSNVSSSDAEKSLRQLPSRIWNGRLCCEDARMICEWPDDSNSLRKLLLARLLGRACAALKLASLRAPDDARVLERVGESLLEYCDPFRAGKIFRRAID